MNKENMLTMLKQLKEKLELIGRSLWLRCQASKNK